MEHSELRLKYSFEQNIVMMTELLKISSSRISVYNLAMIRNQVRQQQNGFYLPPLLATRNNSIYTQ